MIIVVVDSISHIVLSCCCYGWCKVNVEEQKEEKRIRKKIYEFDWIRFAFSTIPSSSSLSQSILLLLLFIDIMIHVTIDPPLIEIEDLRVILTKKIENKFGMSIH